MPSCHFRSTVEPRHRVLLIALWSAFSLTGVQAAASHDDEPATSAHAVERKASVAKQAVPDGKPAASAPAASDAAAPKRSARDPLELIRERLAARLGASKVFDAASPGVVKVVSQQPAAAAMPGSHTVVASMSNSGRVVGASAAHAARLEAAQRRVSAANHAANAHWAYEGDAGPAAWGALKPDFQTCASGTRQSPIDISDGIKVELDAVQFSYRPSNFRVIDNGHTVQVNLAVGNTIEVTGKRYELIQFHFHRPSEERINGKPFDMVAHLVHKSVDGKLAVIAVLLDRGSAQPVVQTVWNNLPLEKGDEVMAKGQIDLMALLPTDSRYYTYMGSLTTPPCSEGVLWMVMKTPVEISPEQLSIFSRLYPMNARPIQAASGRIIKESN